MERPVPTRRPSGRSHVHVSGCNDRWWHHAEASPHIAASELASPPAHSPSVTVKPQPASPHRLRDPEESCPLCFGFLIHRSRLGRTPVLGCLDLSMKHDGTEPSLC